MRALLVLAVAAALLAAPAALADGDPASDYLLGQPVFLPFDAKIPQADQARLLATVQQAKKQGYTIRVALIWSDYDLGSIPELMGQPKSYAKFLWHELSFVYKGRLLVAMPNGLGYYDRTGKTAAEQRVLSRIAVQKTPGGLARATTTAVERLAAQAGYRVKVGKVTTQAQQNQRDRIVIIAAVVAVLLAAAAVRLLLRRRASSRSA